MKTTKNILLLLLIGALLSFSFIQTATTYTITVNVNELRNTKGVIQFSLYNTDGSIPDEHYKRYYKQLKATIHNNSSRIVFKDIPEGIYAINILHDENKNGIIDKGWILPIEGIGFSNLKSISPFNRPNFKKTKITVNADKSITVKIIYL